MSQKGLRAGVYVDVENIAPRAADAAFASFDTLRGYATRDGADAIRLNAYLAFDEERAGRDYEYRSKATRFVTSPCATHRLTKVIEEGGAVVLRTKTVKSARQQGELRTLDLAVDNAVAIGQARPCGAGFRRR